ncbi:MULTISPECIES: RNA polymerase sigma factor [Tenacibaculum]|uniref:Sigma-70 family RNA polymerase sigma factor n=1 Tax=Tenacibaculum aiptasiae TaxID=426481 RepID=A0A7J5AM46_9FLAO|nr:MULTISPECIES: sigma-70 family RNA polymerase sigma factor [Tenacibaculum]KAB1158635.1 sigma-70 family RNA polymerase sigma factor [Tenacibaculum aiptasiae]MCF2875092.1 sigma-70 family RNA polymerase sigma factor [Tenacibaculum sp. Cn5-1]MCF2935168.1 sigma-70 family RNA polymerase sigma factor [Tenacibaculum sp. Cn5-34]MCG7511390.1 sigma-70 family RNA polymerase sigma factor [Tenacibaculum sp. Cn5-46]
MNQSDFLKVVLPFKDKVFRLAKRLLVSREEAEDATQELYFKLWRNKEKLSNYKNVEAFAMTMTKNYCYDRLKSKQASNLTLVHSNYKEKDTSLDKRVEHNDSVNQVHKLIEKLPEQQKIIIQLRDIEQYDFDEICKMVDMKPTAVRVALSRARKTIRQELIKKHNYGVS